jgi:hypothetical protein
MVVLDALFSTIIECGIRRFGVLLLGSIAPPYKREKKDYRVIRFLRIE